MTQAPSRQTYLASARAARVVAAGFLTVWDRVGVSRRGWVYALAALIVAHNCVYLWTIETTKSPSELIWGKAEVGASEFCWREH
jgi:hypothetical protein